MFTRADKNGDGKLDPAEWQSVLNSSGIPTSRSVFLRFPGQFVIDKSKFEASDFVFVFV